eukprot:TRINITY_DN1618_c0_g1_i5.p1 TRINITY_DN1618_c0_g1~~TRINITY_DN1618_c0_g1_i5.p1  ORF type:complete len:159 (+),score=25.26 TRINITY_DN1618_c0_g1_i5:129-605(+)
MKVISPKKDEYGGHTQDSFIKMLSEKVRRQAERILALETYKDLCEKRIKDFSADHPLPVKPEHIGQSITSPHFGGVSESSRKSRMELETLRMENDRKTSEIADLRAKLASIQENMSRERLEKKNSISAVQLQDQKIYQKLIEQCNSCLLYTSPSPRDS